MTEREFRENIYPLHDKMYRFALVLLGNKEQAEDVVQEVFEKLWKRSSLVFLGKKTEAFVISSVRNACFDLLRRRKFSSAEEPKESGYERDVVMERDEERMVRTIIAKLDHKMRMIVELKDIEGYENKEIASIMRMSEANVRAVLSRARKELRIRLSKELNYGA